MIHLAPQPSSFPPEDGTARTLDVLIVDDEEGSRTALCAAVSALGHRCRLASSGSEALRLHEGQRADVIVSDWRMAGMDGMELCRRVRALDGQTYTYLLFTSGAATKRDFVDAVRAGADDCLLKPIDIDDLEARLIAAGRVVSAYRALAERNVGLRHDSLVNFRSARIDPLTGIANRLRLEEDLEALQAQVSRYGRRVTIAMCDLDEFKRYNDHHGHLAGDEALRRIAHAIRKSLRRADQVYRYGGEEFLAVLPEQAPGDAAGAMNRVREAVERLGIEHAPDAKHAVVTVSVGLATVSGNGDRSLRGAIARADRGLYRAKASGGNLVAAESDPVAVARGLHRTGA
ncbi:MAG TPA: GTP cyclohydrolase IIa [Polyangiaceae bacterium]|jgi:two-component system chemotaxis response regulator CheY